MTVCGACGHESSNGAKFCPACGAPVAVGAAARRVTEKGSMELAEQLDPDLVRIRERARAELEQ